MTTTTKTVIFGNSGSGKSTLAKRLSKTSDVGHLDLDTIAWLASTPPERMPLEQSIEYIQDFLKENENWVIEGCYSDLIELVLPHSSKVIFLNLPLEVCIQNAKSRPWEPHKYSSKQAQEANLEMLIDWIKQYETRTDTFSQKAHQALFEKFVGAKIMYTANERLVP
mgnify:CR=1 FL=1